MMLQVRPLARAPAYSTLTERLTFLRAHPSLRPRMLSPTVSMGMLTRQAHADCHPTNVALRPSNVHDEVAEIGVLNMIFS